MPLCFIIFICELTLTIIMDEHTFIVIMHEIAIIMGELNFISIIEEHTFILILG